MIKNLWSWEATQARKDAQMSNPATPMTPTNSDIATQPTDKVVTSDPTNGGVTGGSNILPNPSDVDISALNRWLTMAGFAWANPTKLSQEYGVPTGGFSFEETQNIQQYKKQWDEIYERTIAKSTNVMEQDKKNRFIKDMRWIDLSKKQANSGSGIHPDIWGTFEDTTDIAEGFIKSPQIINNKELIANWSVSAFKNAYDIFEQAIKDSMNLDIDARTASIQASIGDLKISMIPLINKAKGILYVQWWWTTAWYTRLDSFSKELSNYERLYKSSSEDIQNTIKAYSEQEKKFDVTYKKLDWTSPSQNAKTKLNENKAYQIFLETMSELNPEFTPIIQKFKEDPNLSQEEKKFIEQHFEKGMLKSFFEARSRAIAQFWRNAAADYNKFTDIVEVSKLNNKSWMDDAIENMKHVEVDPNQLMFYINKGY